MSRKQRRMNDVQHDFDELTEGEGQEADDAMADDGVLEGNEMLGAQMAAAVNDVGSLGTGYVGLGTNLANFMAPDAGRTNPANPNLMAPDADRTNVVQLEPPPRPPKQGRTVDYVRRRVVGADGRDAIELTTIPKRGREIVAVKQLRPADGSTPAIVIVETRVVSPPGKGAVA